MIRLIGLCMALLLAFPALGQTRHALVIGIDDYTHVAPLQKARNDALAVAAALRAVGFETDLLLDADQLEIATSLARLAARISPGDEVVFFFAGHGIEIEGRNYLLPADVPMASPGQEIVLLSRSIEVATILDTLRIRGARISLLILDACRDNPFPRQGTRSIGGGRGLTQVVAPEGTFIMFSAGNGQAALDRLSADDPDPNSVFTRVLLPRLTQPGIPIHQLAREVRTEVRQLARQVDHEQFPAVYDQFDGEFALVPSDAISPSPRDMPALTPRAAQVTADDICERARDDWAMIMSTSTASLIEAFIGRHADCALVVAIARERLTTLITAPAPRTVPQARLVAQGECALQIALFNDRTELANYIATLPDFAHRDLEVYETDGRGWAVTLGHVAREQRGRALDRIRASRELPHDAFCSDGATYLWQVEWRGLGTTRDILRIHDPIDGWLNFRTGPGTSHSIIRRLDNGEKVQVLRRSGPWAQVLTPAHERGWVFENYTVRLQP